MWLWPPLLQKELDDFCVLANNRRMRKQKEKLLPSGVTPNKAYSLPEDFGGTDCLQPVDLGIIQEILDDMRPEHEVLTDWGVSPEFAERAEAILRRLKIKEVTLTTVWVIFASILSHL